jgi:hypothetical protein
MEPKRSRYIRYLWATLVAGLVFSMVYGFAAALSLNTNTLGAKTTAVSACQAGTFTASYAPTYAAGIPGYAAGTVTLSGLTAACYNLPFKVTLSNAAGTSLAEVTGTTPNSGTTFTATFAAVDASLVANISLEVSG